MTNNFPTLESDRLLLRQFKDNDIENVFKGLSHPDVIKYYAISFNSLEATQEQMDWFANLEATQTGIWWAICSKDDGTFLGAGGFNNRNEHKVEIGFWLYPEHWGKGYMTEAVPLLCTYAFEVLGLHWIEGFVETENNNCKKALAKLQFNHEETQVDCEEKNGKLISVAVYRKRKLE